MKKKTKKEDKILEKIENAIVTEEMAVPIYTQHFATALFWAGISDSKREEIMDNLRILSRESKKHARMLNNVKKLYKKGKK